MTLKGDPTQATRDRYGRILAYVYLPGGRDLGYQLLADGFAKVYAPARPFKRLNAYRTGESKAKHARRGLWRACGAPSVGRCHPSYSPCLPIRGDLDCGEIADSKKPIRVRGSDPYRLDDDNDGLGCEPTGQ